MDVVAARCTLGLVKNVASFKKRTERMLVLESSLLL